MRSSLAHLGLAALAVLATACSSGGHGQPTPDANNLPQCSDGIDNDGDGKIDFPNDPGCLNANQDSEVDDCPNGANCPQCGNGIDDDGDGKIDYPNDPGCASASDPTEQDVDLGACGPNVKVNPITPGATVTGAIVVGNSTMISQCGGLGPEVAYQIDVTAPSVIVATTTGTVDTVLYLRGLNCTDATTELACNDNSPGVTAGGSTLSAPVQPGTYFLIVDTATSSDMGPYSLHVDVFPGAGQACDAQHMCAPGFYCRTAPGASSDTCQPPHCSDGYDNDGDQKIDYPNDPGCDSPSDDDEADDCPSGPNCPACANGVDDDKDGKIDYPADPDCKSASQPTESCGTEQDPLGLMTTGTVTGNTSTAHDDWKLSCGGGPAPDVVYLVQLPHLDSLSISTLGSSFDTVLGLSNMTCSGTLACNDEDPSTTSTSLITTTNVAAGFYSIIVDGYDTSFDTSAGAFTLSVTGTITPGGRCDGALAVAGALTCGSGTTCDGTICKGTNACDNGLDDDHDGHTDYPNDPGCSSPTDDDETDDCPSGPNCPACSNGKDDDQDGYTDYPADSSCTSAAGVSESCTSADPILTWTTTTVTGDTTGKADDFHPACDFDVGGPDEVYQVDVPALDSLTISSTTTWVDEVAILGASCGGAELACAEPAATATGLAAGRYFVVIDGDSNVEHGTFSMTMSGTIAAGGSCESALAKAGALTCGTGYACKGTLGSRTCQKAACNDGVDNDSPPDGKIDYPNDPGCTSPSDDSETDDCPSGPNCPVCSNGKDDDMDGLTDYPADTSCKSAAGTSESCASIDPVLKITTASTMGSTTTAADDFSPTCAGTPSGNDQVYQLDVPAMATLTLDASVNNFDDVIELLDGSCGGTAIDCNDTPGTLNETNVAAGRYFVVVDGYGSSNSGTYVLAVSGTIAQGGSCEGALATSGVITCVGGTTCKGTAGSRTCAP
jgi:hypothetical protein